MKHIIAAMFVTMYVLGFSPQASAEALCSNHRTYPIYYAYNRNSDGYIYKGKIYLTRVGSGRSEEFLLYEKRGVRYVAKRKSGPYYKLTRRMKINNIEYTY